MKKLNRATRYMLIVSAVLIALNVMLGYLLTKQSSHAMRTLIDERMLDISNTAAAMIDGDDLAVIRAEDEDTPAYQNVLKTLTYFQDNIELEYIYCIRAVGEREFVFTIDPTVEDPGEFGQPIVYTEALYNASKGRADVDDEPYEDDWGKFYSSYSPVFDSEGNVAGIVAVDFSADWYQRQMARLGMITGGIIAVALFFSIVTLALIASQYQKSFKQLFRKMNELSDGIEELIHEVSPEMEDDSRPVLTNKDSNRAMNDEVDLIGEKVRVMQDRLARQIEKIRSQAYIDGLTGLHNRTSYEDYLQTLEKKIGNVPRLVFTVVVFDINQLKIINDDYGHEKGDMLISSVANDLIEAFPGDRLFRIGGDEFVAILDDPDPSPKLDALRAIIARKNAESPILHDQNFDVGVSMGSATFDWQKDKSYIDVFNRADVAMYADKRAFYQTHEDRRKKR